MQHTSPADLERSIVSTRWPYALLGSDFFFIYFFKAASTAQYTQYGVDRMLKSPFPVKSFVNPKEEGMMMMIFKVPYLGKLPSTGNFQPMGATERANYHTIRMNHTTTFILQINTLLTTTPAPLNNKQKLKKKIDT